MASSALSGIPISITFNPDKYRNRENHIIEHSNRFVYITGLPKEAGPTRESVLAAVRNQDLREIVQQVSTASGKTFTIRGQAANITSEEIIALLEAFLWLKDNEAAEGQPPEDPDASMEVLQSDEAVPSDGDDYASQEAFQEDAGQPDADGCEFDAEDTLKGPDASLEIMHYNGAGQPDADGCEFDAEDTLKGPDAPLEIMHYDGAGQPDAEDWNFCSGTEQSYDQAVEKLRAVKEKTGLTLQI